MKKSYILPLFAAAVLATGCSKEDPFGMDYESSGQFLKSALAVDIDADGIDVRTTRAAEANVDDFTVLFNSDELAQPIKYRYGDMPEIVTLPAGTYTVTATYGENREADWENPYFLGTSEEFNVVPMEITSYVEPIICTLENVMVSIDFDSALRQHMSKDSYIEVKVGQSSSLKYGVEEADAKKAGYFKHSEEKTLVAVFHGIVDGSEITETRSMKDIEKGNHYKITFKLHQGADSDFSGSVGGQLEVDATVTVVNVETNVPFIEDELLDDSERPSESEDPGQGGEDNPQQPDDPTAPQPEILPQGAVDLNGLNKLDELDECVLKIYSHHDNGITALSCDIVSELLTTDVLQELGLDTHLDLVNTPESMQTGLQGLDLPYCVKGEKQVVFNITKFITILSGMSDPGQVHQFVITVTDANGTCTKTLKLQK